MELETVMSGRAGFQFAEDETYDQANVPSEGWAIERPVWSRTDFSRAACYVVAAVVGTGGFGIGGAPRVSYAGEFFTPTGSIVSVGPTATYIMPEGMTLTAISDQVALIKSAFGLSIRQLASALQVQRPTVYAWLDPDTAPETLRNANRTRLEALYSLAQAWNQLSKWQPGEYLPFLLEFLTQPELNVEQTKAALVEVSSRVQATEVDQPLGERLRAAGFAEVPRKSGGIQDSQQS